MRDANCDPVHDPSDEELLRPSDAIRWLTIAKDYGLIEFQQLLQRVAEVHADALKVANNLDK